jgi:hypothetical protein
MSAPHCFHSYKIRVSRKARQWHMWRARQRVPFMLETLFSVLVSQWATWDRPHVEIPGLIALIEGLVFPQVLSSIFRSIFIFPFTLILLKIKACKCNLHTKVFFISEFIKSRKDFFLSSLASFTWQWEHFPAIFYRPSHLAIIFPNGWSLRSGWTLSWRATLEQHKTQLSISRYSIQPPLMESLLQRSVLTLTQVQFLSTAMDSDSSVFYCWGGL